MTLPPVLKTVTVNCPPGRAFRYFTEGFGRWWPAASHSVVAFRSEFKELPAACVMESGQGGRIYERASDGTEYKWGQIFVWDPPERVAFTWHPGRDEETAQVVEVTFHRSPGGTLVKLEHSGWEKAGEDAEASRSSYENGWETVFVRGYGLWCNEEVSIDEKE